MSNEIRGQGVVEGEGPVAMLDGSVWVVEMANSRAAVTRVAADGDVATRIKVSGRPNGMTLDGDGRLWVAEARNGLVVCFDQDGHIVTTVRHPTGRFLWPNDLRFGPDGHLYLTDSGILDTDFISGIDINPEFRNLPYDGCIYEIDPISAKVIRRFDQGLKFTNGLAFGPDDLLYVNETLTGAVYRYNVFASSTPIRDSFGNVNKDDGLTTWRGPDGMAFGSDGRLYCTVYGQGDVTVLDENGKVSERLATNGPRPTNIAFALGGAKQAYVTEVLNSAVEIISTPCGGLPLHAPRLPL